MLPRSVQERFRALAGQVVESGLVESKSWISDEWRRAASPEGSARIFRYWSAIATAGGVHPAGKACLDAGCGAGLLTVMLCLAGARRVLAVDVLPQAVRIVGEVLRLGGWAHAEVVQCDVAQLPVTQGPFDLAYAIEAISHYRDYRSFLQRTHALLAAQGRLVIRDANNGANPATVRRTREIWRAAEHGHPSGRCHGHICAAEGYLGARRAILREALPALSEEQVEQYARWTFAYDREQTIAAARRFSLGDLSLRSEYRADRCPLDPQAGWYSEQLFHPYRLAAEMRSLGFRPRVHAHLADRYPLADAVWGWLSPLTVRWSRGFVIVAGKMRNFPAHFASR